MRGAVATGNPHTSAAAEEILHAGGNAVDAAIAACLAAFVAEPLLASAGGSGMLTAAAPGADPLVVDFFSSMPGRGVPMGTPRDFEAVELDFGSATQVFHIGRGSAAAPLSFAGLAEASKRLGRIPLHHVVEPAIALARSGAEVTPESAGVFELLWPINLRDDATAQVYSATGNAPRAGDKRPIPEMAELLEAFGEEARSPRHFDEAILKHFGPSVGGRITRADLKVVPWVGPPRTQRLAGCELLTSPRLGGRLLTLIAKTLAGSAPALGADEWARVAEACRAGSRAKGDERALGSTTHISVIDGEGGAASVTLTNGEGSGHCVPGTGVQMNNFLGEEDLHPDGFFEHAPGTELPSMIAPTIVRDRDSVMALGSGGANRIRSVVAQVLYRVVALDSSLEDAVMTPRIHAEEESVWYEALGFGAPAEERAVKARLEQEFDRVFDFPGRAFFFGGVHAARKSASRTEAFADPRRGGAALVL